MLEAGHEPVLLAEVLEVLRPAGGKVFLDGTFGCGGHSVALLRHGVRVVALDQDAEAERRAGVVAEAWGEMFEFHRMNFRELAQGAERFGLVDGVLLDLGVSSPQLDQAGRGFSFLREGPLDMRMDGRGSLTAEVLVNERSEKDLEEILREFGEEREAKRIVRGIVRARETRPIRTTTELAEVVAGAVSARRGHGRTHPATKTFQALRIAVNDELGALDDVLDVMPSLLKVGGRMAVISFHSLEDRRVKRFIARTSEAELRGEGMAFGRPNPDYFFRKLGDWKATDEEIARNGRARSARLRGAERIGHGA